MKPTLLGCVSLLKKWKKIRWNEMQWSVSAPFFHLICIFLAMMRISYFNLWFNVYFPGKLLSLSVQHHLSQYLMLYLILSKTSYQSPVFRVILGSPVKTCLWDISFSKHRITAKIIHPLDMSHTQTKLYLLLNHISDGAALLENCMLCVWFMSQHI